MPGTNIVISAFGPVDRTRRAVRRARSLAGGRRVHVVPADPELGDTLRDVGVRAQVARLRGAHGLLEVLDGLPDAPTVILHDDVELTARSLAALVEASRTTGAIAVPHTNDSDTDHTIGSLPIGAAAADLDAARDRTTSTRAVETVRPVCVVGRPEQLLGLVPFDVTAAGAILRSLGDDLVAVQGAVAAHENVCLHGSAREDDRPLLVASMIVRDEEAMLPECLASLHGVVDRIVVCDTGSVDRTVEIAEAAGAEVIHRTWRDDFAWARNEALEPCRDARYVLQIDADERLVCDDPAALRATLAAAAGEYHALRVWLDSLDDRDGVNRTRWRFARIFDPNVAEFHGRLHEAPRSRTAGLDLREVNLDGVELHHHGYTPEVFEAKDKSARNIAIAEAAFAEDETLHNALHLARTLEMLPDGHERALTIFETWLPRFESDLGPATVAYAKTAMARALHRAGRFERALEVALEAFDLVPADAGAALAAAEAAAHLDRPETVIEVARGRREARSLSPTMSRDIVLASVDALEAVALVLTGEVGAGFDRAGEVVRRSPAVLHRWDVLVRAAQEHPDHLPGLVELASLDTTGRAVAAVMTTLRPADTARFCLRSAQAGCADAELVRVGVVAAMVSGAWDEFDDFRPFLSRLSPEVRQDIRTRLRDRGEPQRAAALAA